MSILVFLIVIFTCISAIFFVVSIRCLSDVDKLYKNFADVCREHENIINQYYDNFLSIHKDVIHSKNEVIHIIQQYNEKKEQTP